MLWIFDETGEQAGLRVFTDALVSLVRQWTFHSSVWRIAFGALVSCLLLAGWWHFQEAALASENAKPASNRQDRKSTRQHSSHVSISYAVFCLKKKKKKIRQNI